jgi:hypothetical protein
MADTPTNQARLNYEKALKNFNILLGKVETDNRQKVKLQEKIQEARERYKQARAIVYPKHFPGQIAT